MPERKIRVMVAKPGWMGMTEAPAFSHVVFAMPDLKLFIQAVIKHRNKSRRQLFRKTLI